MKIKIETNKEMYNYHLKHLASPYDMDEIKHCIISLRDMIETGLMLYGECKLPLEQATETILLEVDTKEFDRVKNDTSSTDAILNYYKSLITE